MINTTVFNANVIEIENKIPDTSILATKATLDTKTTEFENKMLDTSHFINTQEFSRLIKLKKLKKGVKMYSKTMLDHV